MSRRKQSRPRPVKAVGESPPRDDPPPLNLGGTRDDVNDDDDDGFLSEKNLLIALSPRNDSDDNNNNNNNNSNNTRNGSHGNSKDVTGQGVARAGHSGVPSNRHHGGREAIVDLSTPTSGLMPFLTKPKVHESRSSVLTPPSSTKPLPPNFLLRPLPSSHSPSASSYATASSFPSFDPINPYFFPPPPAVAQRGRTVPPASSSSTRTSQSAMARRKRSPTSIRWNHRALSHQPGSDADKCLICTTQTLNGSEPKTPVEKEDYFMDSDGTLTIKNGICPRTLALNLLTELSQNPVRFESEMGKHLNVFVLNLEQILKSHNQTCPGETATQLLNAETFIEAHKASQKQQQQQQLLLGHSRKRRHDNDHQRSHHLTSSPSPEVVKSVDIPDNFLALPPAITDGNDSDSGVIPSMVLPIGVFPELQPSSLINRDDNNNNNNSNNNNNNDNTDMELKIGMTSHDGGSLSDIAPSLSPAGMTSQAASPSPSPSLSSTPSGMTVAEAAIANKQMANTKRGSKILPVASSTDGLVKYNCPICNLELSGDHDLTVHIRSHNQTSQQTAPNTCTICGKTLSSQSSLDRHMLVHSGERPFKCKICDMSFTTNGNMHRHSRIHEKNGINIKAPGRKSSEAKLAAEKGPASLPSPSPSPSSVSGNQAAHLSALMAGFRDPEKASPRPSSHHQQDQSVEFLQYLNELNKLQQLNYRNYLYPFPGPHHSAFPYSPLVADPLTYMQAMIDPTTGEPLNKRICLPHRVMPHPREPSPDLRAPKTYNCPECNATFKSQFSLESHMESHVIVDKKLEAEGGAACKTCKTIAKSEESLLLHTLTHHKVEEELSKPDSNSSPPLSPSSAPAPTTLRNNGNNKNNNNSSSNSNNKKLDKVNERDGGNEIPTGFMDLGFANFTTKKFPLIAKAFCEDNADLKGQKFPVFKCQECDKEFPVEGAKNLHEASHVPEEYTRCPKCDCHFADSSRLQEHMLKHVSDLKFEKSLEQDNDDKDDEENGKVSKMPQNYFLAQFGLITAEDHGTTLNTEDADMEREEEEEKHMDVNPSEDGSMDVSLQDTAESMTSNEMTSQGQTGDCESQILTLPIKREDVSKIISEEKKSSASSSLSDVDFLQDSKSYFSKLMSSSSSEVTTTDKITSHSQSSSLLPSTSSSRSQDRVLPPTFQCKHCDVVLHTAKAFKHHQSMHKDGQQFKCKVCPYVSTDKSTLLRHMRTHSGERPYKCKLCDYSFTTKANCERHLRQKHGLHTRDNVKEKLIHLKFDLQDIIQTTRKAGSSSSSSLPGDKSLSTMCESCGVDFQHYHSLQQHLHNNPDCCMVFACKSCKMTFPTKQGISQHMSKKHADVPPHLIGQLVSSVENGPDCEGLDMELSTPPPAHAVTKADPKATLEDIDKATTSSRLLKSYLMKKSNLMFPQQLSAPDIVEASKPLDFSKKNSSTPDSKKGLMAAEKTTPILPSNLKLDAGVSEDEPMDLSVSRPSTSPSSPSKVEDNQAPLALLVKDIKQEPRSPAKAENANAAIPNSNTTGSFDGNNNQLSSLFINPLAARPSLNAALSQSLRPARGGLDSNAIPVIPSTHRPKHPAFPQFLPIMLPTAAPSAIQLMSKQGHERSPSSSSSSSVPSAAILRATSPLRLSRSLFGEKGQQQLHHMQPSVVLEDLKKDGKKAEKGSSSGSESSCELASINKMLDATDAQNFQDYLMIPETEDEQDSKSDSIESEEDSNASMENLFSKSQSFKSGQQKISEQTTDRTSVSNAKNSPDDSKKEADDEPERTVTVGMALMEGGIPTTVFKDSSLNDSIDDDKIDIPDPSNMSEQAIAKLIEKVSRENASYPIKKKRNSYADSPHKFTCPYCPRCFPWLSSLNRHLLTHTGQKPFKCPRCPVTFSTKSNRERHLIRKHNVNMLDPASRSTMDRPYKCHLCVFSSFATQSNLIKHYKERHDGASPPLKALEAIDMLDSEMDEISGKTCEEEEEEYAMIQIQNNGLTDQDLMLQNYAEEEDSQDSMTSYHMARDPHKKRNAIFDLLPDHEASGNKEKGAGGKNGLKEHHSLSNGSNGKISSSSPKSLSNILTLPGIDETVLTDTMKAFLGKSIQQSLEDSQRKALEEGSTFNITPAIERHLRRLPKAPPSGNNHTPTSTPTATATATATPTAIATATPNQGMIQCVKCDEQFATKKQLLTHFKSHLLELPFACHLCELAFPSRVECLQHQTQAHPDAWQAVAHTNGIGNLAVFATRLDKGIVKVCKKGRDILDRLERDKGQQEETAKLKDVPSTDSTGKEAVEETEPEERKNEAESEKESSTTATELASEQKDDLLSPTLGEDSLVNNFLNEVLSTDYLQRKVHCAVCPKRFWSQQDLKRHMKSHSAKGGKDSSMDRKPESAEPSKDSAVASAVDQGVKGDNGKKTRELDKADEDMLHNLLGVESSTIDQIFESKDSAASLLGFSQNSQS